MVDDNKKYVLAIDQGTTSSRAIIFDGDDGHVVHVKGYPFEQKYPNPGWCEQDPYDILESTIRSINDISDLITTTTSSSSDGISSSNISSIGITNQRETLIAWDKLNGKPLYNAIVWLDLRTYDTVKALTMNEGKDRFRNITGLPISTYFTALKIKWLLDNIDDVNNAVKEGRCLFGTVDSWLTYNLTGGYNNNGIHVTDVTNASRYMLMDLNTLQWDKGICDELGIPIETLPTIVPSCGIIGRVNINNNATTPNNIHIHPLLDNVPITAILGDQQSALLGHGCVKEGQAKCTYGTGCFMLVNTGHQPIQSSFGLLTTVAFQKQDGPVYYALEGSVAIAGRAVQWLRDQLGVIESAPEVEELAKTVPNTGGVTVVPAFSGLFTPHWRPDARAVITGMTLSTTKAHICRAVLEGVALEVVDVVRVMEKELDKPIVEFYADGGMTANRLLMQMQADFLPKDIQPAVMAETTAFGAAYAAGLAIGLWKVPIVELIANLGGHRKIEPHPAALERRKAIRRRWNDAIERTLGLEEYCPLPDAMGS